MTTDSFSLFYSWKITLGSRTLVIIYKNDREGGKSHEELQTNPFQCTCPYSFVTEGAPVVGLRSHGSVDGLRRVLSVGGKVLPKHGPCHRQE